jgi:hypothetical protein
LSNVEQVRHVAATERVLLAAVGRAAGALRDSHLVPAPCRAKGAVAASRCAREREGKRVGGAGSEKSEKREQVSKGENEGMEQGKVTVTEKFIRRKCIVTLYLTSYYISIL